MHVIIVRSVNLWYLPKQKIVKKGHSTLAAKLRQEPMQRQGKRCTTRIMCHAYGRGIVRGQVENTHLRAYTRPDDVTAAEYFKTCQTEK